MGWYARKHGLAANHVTAIEVVTADGQIRCGRATSTSADLFWALRGGGGNFGVVTAIEFELLPLEQVYAGALFFPVERSREVLHAWRDWTAGRARRGHLGRPDPPVPAARRDPRAAARQVVRRRRGGLPRRRGRGARGCSSRCARSAR